MMKANTKVCLLFKESHETLSDNLITLVVKNGYQNCITILKMIQSSKKYDRILVELKESSITKSVESRNILGDCHYITHHPIFREDKKLVR